VIAAIGPMRGVDSLVDLEAALAGVEARWLPPT